MALQTLTAAMLHQIIFKLSLKMQPSPNETEE